MRRLFSILIKFCLSGILLAAPAWPQAETSGIITTIAGNGVIGYSGDGGPAVSAQLHRPNGLALDAAGNLYIADRLNHRIRRIDPSGIITTVAGNGNGGYSGDNGPAVQAELNEPRGVAVDSAGNLYIADTLNSRIRRVDVSGTITTVTGTGAGGFSGDGGPAVQAQLDRPYEVAVDDAGNLYIADTNNNRIRRVDITGTITSIAGTGATGYGAGGYSGDGGPAVQAQLSVPRGVAMNASGNLYIADSGNSRVRMVDTAGNITTVAGNGSFGHSGDGGPAVQAEIATATVTVDGVGNLYLAENYYNRIRRVDPKGIINTIVGTGEHGYSGDGGPADQAQLNSPIGVVVDQRGNLYIADASNQRIRRVSLPGVSRPPTMTEWTIDTIAGRGIGDTIPAVAALLLYPSSVVVDAAGNLYIADSRNHRIRRVDTRGIITTVAGNGEWGYSGDGGPAVRARLGRPMGLALDGAGNLYFAEASGHRIRRVDAATGAITTVAGTGEQGYSGDGGTAVRARLLEPLGLAVDAAGNLYIADSRNHRIRRVDTRGIISTVAGTGPTGDEEGGFSGDGGPAVQARLRFPTGVAVDRGANLYIADFSNHRIRRVDAATGTITTVAGTGEPDYSGDGGPAVRAQLDLPYAVALDGTGNLYIAGDRRVRQVDARGVITTVAGTDEWGFSGDGGSAVQARITRPLGVAVNRTGNLYIADFDNSRIRQVDPSGIITTVAGGASGWDNVRAVETQLGHPFGLVVGGAGNLYIADSRNHRVRRVDATGTNTTVAGTGEPGFGGDGGPAVFARLSRPHGLAVDAAGNLYIADTNNGRIRRVDARGKITTVAGNGEWGYSGDGGPAVQAKLASPTGVAVDGAGNLYIADTSNHRIRRVDPGGTITTILGGGSRLLLSSPFDVAVDGAGNLYITDSGNQRIQRMNANGGVSFIVGTTQYGFGGDGGPAHQALLATPTGVAVSATGNVYIADSGNQRIRRVNTQQVITTIAGTGEAGFSGDGGPASRAKLRSPRRVAVDGAGNLYIADTDNHRIRVLRQTSALPPPTHLSATPVSPSRIDLAWQDNSTSETGFKVQRRQEGSGEWVEAGETAANATTYSDTELLPATVYHHRVQAFNDTASSAFSNEAMATTQPALPPTLTRFSPASGPVGTRVTLTGTHFLGATDVQFNGVDSLDFEVVSMTGIRAVVPPGAASGQISVVTSGGTAMSAEPFTVTGPGSGSRLFVPVILTSAGRNNAFFTSELTLTNRGTQEAILHYTYTADAGGGSGTATDSLAAGRQRIQSNAIEYLTRLGIPIPGSGNRIGTLRVEVSGSSEVSVVTRTTTAVPEGRAGLAYPGIARTKAFQEAVYLCGLRENRQDRSNVAVQHAGDSSEEDLTLRVTVFSGDSAESGRSVVFPDLSLPPGGFHQYNGILNRAGFDNGYVKVERVSGAAAFYAYGVINDNFNSDGSFVFPLTEPSLVGASGQTLPVIIETGAFASELTVTNFSASEKQVDFSFVADAVQTAGDTTTFSLRLKAGEQRILPNLVDWLRQQGVAGIGPAGRAFVGALFATPTQGDMSGIVIGARTGSPDQRGGQYSLFYNGVPYGSASIESAWVYGLQQNAENRSNLALVNTGEIDDSSSTFEITIYDGSGESDPRTKMVTLGPRRWRQENGILGNFSQGYVQVRKTSGNNPFVTYGVVNDGGRPGERSGDGAFLLSQE